MSIYTVYFTPSNISESRVSQIHSGALKRLRHQTTQQQMASMLLGQGC